MKTIVLDRQTLAHTFPASPARADVSIERTASGSKQMRVTLAVSDRSLRTALGADGDKFNGLENPVALVPTGNEFKRYQMRYLATVGGGGTTPVVDHYELLLGDGQFSQMAAIETGVALLLETKLGDEATEIWLQKENDNYKFDPVR